MEWPPESGPPTGIDCPLNWRISDGWKTREFEAFRHWIEECRRTEKIVSYLQQVELLQRQGATISEAVRQIGAARQTFYRLRKPNGGMQQSQTARLKEVEKENLRLRQEVFDLTLDKLILIETAKGNF